MIRNSPFAGVHERMGARFAHYGQWRMPSDYGDPAAEVQALREGCAAFDLSSFGRVTVRGAGADALMTAVCDGAALPFEGQWAAVGPLVGSGNAGPLRVAALRDGYMVLTPPDRCEPVLQALLSEAQRTGNRDVQVADVTEKTAMLGLYGPRSFEAVASILPIDVCDLEPGTVVSQSVMMLPITVLRGSWVGCDGLELICPASAAPMAAGALAKYHKQQHITPGGMDCLLSAMGGDQDLR